MRVLAIVPQGEDRERVRVCASDPRWTVEYCSTVREAMRLLASRPPFMAILLDRDAADTGWEQAFLDLAPYAGAARIILASRTGGDGQWERVVEHGGHDVVTKPLRADQVHRAIVHAWWYSLTVS